MFRQLVTPPGPPSSANSTQALKNVNSLFMYHPLQVSALVETVWRCRYHSALSPFVPWPATITTPLLQDGTNFFSGYDWTGGTPSQLQQTLPPPTGGPLIAPIDQPGLTGMDPNSGLPKLHTNWDHLIWAYVVENTRIFDIFSKVLETYMFSEDLEVPSLPSQLFLRNLEYLVYGDAMPSMVWTTGGCAQGRVCQPVDGLLLDVRAGPVARPRAGCSPSLYQAGRRQP